MKNWYEHSYINRTNWILENYAAYHLTSDEGILVLLINHANEQGEMVNTPLLMQRSGLSEERVDQAIRSLCARQYLGIKAKGPVICFDLSGLFTAETAKSEKAFNQSLYELFESEFGRPLSESEMQQLTDWMGEYEQKLIVYALKEASLYKKLSMPYIASILIEWRRKGLTGEQIEKGERQ